MPRLASRAGDTTAISHRRGDSGRYRLRVTVGECGESRDPIMAREADDDQLIGDRVMNR